MEAPLSLQPLHDVSTVNGIVRAFPLAGPGSRAPCHTCSAVSWAPWGKCGSSDALVHRVKWPDQLTACSKPQACRAGALLPEELGGWLVARLPGDGEVLGSS